MIKRRKVSNLDVEWAVPFEVFPPVIHQLPFPKVIPAASLLISFIWLKLTQFLLWSWKHFFSCSLFPHALMVPFETLTNGSSKSDGKFSRWHVSYVLVFFNVFGLDIITFPCFLVQPNQRTSWKQVPFLQKLPFDLSMHSFVDLHPKPSNFIL